LGGEDKIRAQLEWPGLFVSGLWAEGFALNNKKISDIPGYFFITTFPKTKSPIEGALPPGLSF
jgi:hypothetical protein